MTKENDR